jgi:hypothetical protein
MTCLSASNTLRRPNGNPEKPEMPSHAPMDTAQLEARN